MSYLPLRGLSFVVAMALAAGGAAHAAIDISGDVTPSTAANFPGNRVSIGGTAEGSVSVNGGSTVASGSLSVGEFGSAVVTGAGSSWEFGGLGISGLVLISDGGVGHSKGSDVSIGGTGPGGLLRVTGDGSHLDSGWLMVGAGGVGTLHVQGGGTVYARSEVEIGMQSAGTLVVEGHNSQFDINNNHGTWLGGQAHGGLLVKDGGRMKANGIFAGVGSSAGLDVSGSGAALQNNSVLYMGWGSSPTTLTISNGGHASDLASWIGWETGSTGDVVVTGNNATWETGTMSLGRKGHASLAIADSGRVFSASAKLGEEAGVRGLASVSGAGSRWVNAGALEVGVLGEGSLLVADGGHVEAGYIMFGSNSELFNDNVVGNLTISDGSVALTERTAFIFWDGQEDYSTSQTGIDFLSGGSITTRSDGRVRVRVDVDPTGAWYDTYLTDAWGWEQMYQAGLITFDGDNSRAFNDVFTVSSNTAAGTTTLAVNLLQKGDFNGDGVVDQEDLTLVLANWGRWVGAVEGDMTGVEGDLVDQQELSALLENWGAGTETPVGAATVVPEPAGAAVLLTGAASLGLVRRTRARRGS